MPALWDLLACAFFAALVFLHSCQWYKTNQVYGGIRLRVVAHMVGFAFKTPKGQVLLITAVAASLFAFNVFVRGVAYPLFMVVYACCVTFNNISWNCVPPGALFLTTSTWENADYMMRLKGAMWPLRIVALLDPETVDPKVRAMFALDNLRTTKGEDWQSVVHPLMDMVPIVVLDTRVPSAGVVHEVERVLADPRRLAKTVFVTGPMAESPALDVAAGSAGQSGLCRVDTDALWHLLGYLFARPDFWRGKPLPLQHYARVVLQERDYRKQLENPPGSLRGKGTAIGRYLYTFHPERGLSSLSFCVSGRRVFMPKTDLVGFVDGKREPICVSWEDLTATVGARLAEVPGHAPPRWELAGFLTEDEWATLRGRHVRLP